VINYVAEKYGRDRLAKIFGRNSTLRRDQERGYRRASTDQSATRELAAEAGLPLVGRGDVSTSGAGMRGARGAALHRASDMLKNLSHWRFDPDQF
jgi:hypothetical protein